MATQEEMELALVVQSRLQKTIELLKSQEASSPYCQMWQILVRFEDVFEDKKTGKANRYKIMRWMFPGKWGADEEPSGKDLDWYELNLMERWSNLGNPGRSENFPKEVMAVVAWIDHKIETPVADQRIEEIEADYRRANRLDTP